MSLIDTLKSIAQRTTAAIRSALGLSVEIRDGARYEKGWLPANAGTGPNDRLWADLYDEQQDALEAWLKNFTVRQIVRLTTAFAIGDGIEVSSKRPKVQRFIESFWQDNQMDSRLPAWSDELVRSGELFPVLFSNTGPVREADEGGRPTIVTDGAQVVRTLPACVIAEVVSDPEDYEYELEYHETVTGETEPKVWRSVNTAEPEQPVALHYTINKPIGATRGVSDLIPVIPWARRYSEWLKDRVVFNRLRSELSAAVIKARNVSSMETYIRENPPKNGNITVVGLDEAVEFPAANIGAPGAEADGLALRLAIAAGSGYPLHFFAEGENANRSTASEMGDPTHRFLRMRQKEIIAMVTDLITVAYTRASQLRGGGTLPTFNGDLQIEVSAPDISRADNKALAEAGKVAVEMFGLMRDRGWIDDEIAIRLAFKFLGEIIDEDEIKDLLEMEPETPTPTDEELDDIDDEALRAAIEAGNIMLLGWEKGFNDNHR